MASDNKLFKNSLQKAGKYYVLELTRGLIQADKRVTGNLIQSLNYSVVGNNNNLSLIITAAPYLGVVDKGRRKGAKPPPLSPILKWVQMRGIVFTNKKNGHILTQKQTANVIRYGVSKNGIKPTNILEKTMVKFMNNSVIINQIKDGAKDIINELIKDTFKDIRDKLNPTGTN